MGSPYRDARLPLYRCDSHSRYEASCEDCKAAHREWDRKRDRLIGYGQGSSLVDALPAQRRLQALMRLGWPLAWLGQEIGVSQQSMSDLIWQRSKVSREMDRRVRATFDKLQAVKPVGHTPGERMAISRTIARAIERGYAPPLAWDDESIDDPNAEPRLDAEGQTVDWVRIERVFQGQADPSELAKPERQAAAVALLRSGHTQTSVARKLKLSGATAKRLQEVA